VKEISNNLDILEKEFSEKFKFFSKVNPKDLHTIFNPKEENLSQQTLSDDKISSNNNANPYSDKKNMSIISDSLEEVQNEEEG
jgi:hypothetical protein